MQQVCAGGATRLAVGHGRAFSLLAGMRQQQAEKLQRFAVTSALRLTQHVSPFLAHRLTCHTTALRTRRLLATHACTVPPAAACSSTAAPASASPCVTPWQRLLWRALVTTAASECIRCSMARGQSARMPGNRAVLMNWCSVIAWKHKLLEAARHAKRAVLLLPCAIWHSPKPVVVSRRAACSFADVLPHHPCFCSPLGT